MFKTKLNQCDRHVYTMTFVYGIIHYSPATGGPTACRGAGLLAGLFTLQSTSYFNLNLMFVFDAFDFFAMSKFSVSGVFGVWKIIYTILRINKCIQNYPHGQTNILRIEKLHAARLRRRVGDCLCSVFGPAPSSVRFWRRDTSQTTPFTSEDMRGVWVVNSLR